MQAKEIMTREVCVVNPETSVEEAARLMLTAGVSGLPVVENERVVGIVSEGDILRQARRVRVPAALELLGGIIFLQDTGRFYEDLRRFAASSVGDLMTHQVITARPDMSVEEMATTMIERNVNRLPVVGEDGRLIGIVARRDLVRALY